MHMPWTCSRGKKILTYAVVNYMYVGHSATLLKPIAFQTVNVKPREWE